MSDNQLEKIKRLVHVRKHLNLTQSEFATILGINRANLSAIENGRENRKLPNGTTYIIEKELDVNPNWFETGQGDIFKPKKSESKNGFQFSDSDNAPLSERYGKSPVIEAKPISLHPHNDDDDTGVSKYVYAPDGTMGMRVPIVPIKAQAGYLLGFGDPEYYEDFETEIIPVTQEHKGTYLGFEVKGDSGVSTDPELMEQNIYPGWKVIGKDLPKSKWAYKLHIHKYDRWVIVHRTEGILVKGIVNHDIANGIITIHSHNPEYPDRDLRLEDIEQIFNVVQIVPKKPR